jgi:hypothetical protein
MLRSMNDLENYAIRATDGDVGHVKDFYFDDRAWVIRYLVVDTGSWLSSRKVLISPMAIGHPDWPGKILPVSITKEQVKNSPDIDTDKPVSRQHEMAYLGYFGFPFYWGGAGLWGEGAYSSMMLAGGSHDASVVRRRELEAEHTRDVLEHGADHDGDPHLRSCKEVLTYRVDAIDGDIGHVRGLLVEEDTWAIRYLIVETGNWWEGHEVLIVPQWIQSVSWNDNAVLVNLTRQALKDAPPYDSAAMLDRELEANFYKHYGHQGYWTDQIARHAPTTRP